MINSHQNYESLKITQLINFIDYNPNPIISLDINTNEIYLNIIAKAKFPKLISTHIHHPLIKSAIDKIKEYVASKMEFILFSNEVHFQKRDYELRIFSLGNKSIIYIYVTDITSQKQANEKIKELESNISIHTEKLTKTLEKMSIDYKIIQQNKENISFALKSALVGTWVWDINKDLILWNENMPQIFGNSTLKLTHTLDEILCLVHPEDRCKIDMSANKIRRSFYETSFRVIYPDKSLHVVNMRGEVIYDDNNTPIKMAGVCF